MTVLLDPGRELIARMEALEAEIGGLREDVLGQPEGQAGLVDILLRGIGDLKRAEQALADREDEFRLTFECAAVGIAHVGLDGRFLMVNEALSSLLGYSRQEFARLTFQDITVPEDLAEDLRQVDRLLSGEAARYEMEKRYVRADGTIVWACLAVALKRGGDGAPLYFISVISDISQRKDAEEKLDLAMREMNHRAKNSFTVIQSLIGLTRRSAATVDEFAKALEERITGLSISHDLLMESPRDVASLEALVRRQLRAFVAEDDTRVNIWGPGLELGPESTRTLGLALHELATNACKYGALSTPAGRLDIRWRCVDLSSADTPIVVEWREQGGPPVQAPGRSGFGTRVMRDMVAHSLGAEVVIDFMPAGLVWTATAPISRFAA